MQHYGIEGWKAEGVALLGRLPKDFLGSYGGAARAAPLLTMAATSSVSYFLGDLAAQVVEGRRSARLLDLPRCARNAALGFFLHGPMLHFWIVLVMEGPQFAALEQSNGELAARGAKILLDQTVFSAVINVVYAVIDGVLSDKSLTDSLARARQTLAPALVSSWRFWPAVHLLSYSPLIPVDFKILWIDCMEVIWVAILSTTVNTAPETPKQSVPWNEGLYFDGTPPEAADEQ
ncbi:hypothetical protein M885DRAFT_463118 [Pelagophyceae sp. CCMP2097]|nr:hypothetical protein M885DRAFT_463118 [Pelagophyceae sp. CCMP2097]